MSESRGPKGKGADVRGALLQAGFALYHEQGPEGFSLRQVANRAGVNQAMVRYYFADKHGFEEAMMDESFDRLLAALPQQDNFEQVIAAAVQTLSDMPWLPPLMLRRVYISDSLRNQFLEKHAPRILDALGARLNFRDDVDPVYANLSLLSMMVFPHLARPIVSGVLGLEFDETFATTWASHIARLLRAEPA